MSLVANQPAPVPGMSAAVWPTVIGEVGVMYATHPACASLLDDMAERDRLGRERYGVALQADNGRDHLVDAYQEALDLVAYLRAELMGGGGSAIDLHMAISLAVRLRARLDARLPPHPPESPCST